MTYEEIVTGLHALKAEDFADYVPEQLDELTDAVVKLPEPERAMPELFALMERLPSVHMGSPGPLVHTLERMERAGYIAELVASLRRRPTALSVWMVNRILNSSLPPERRQFFLDLLASVAEHPAADEQARDEAEHYVQYQSTRNT